MQEFLRRLVQQKQTAHVYGEVTIELDGEARVFCGEDIVELAELLLALKGYNPSHPDQPIYVSMFQHREIIEQYQRWATTGRFKK